jgi:D-glycero-D-manno-heptose 1,7-bisphosphate phosphatase
VAVGHKSIQHRTQEQQYTLQVFPELREIYFCPDFEGRNASASPFTSCITS